MPMTEKRYHDLIEQQRPKDQQAVCQMIARVPAPLYHVFAGYLRTHGVSMQDFLVGVVRRTLQEADLLPGDLGDEGQDVCHN